MFCSVTFVIAWRVHKGIPQAKWMLQAHRSVAWLSTLVLFVPCVSLGLRWLDCDNLTVADDGCWSGLHVAGCVVVLVVVPPFVLLAFMTQSVFINRGILSDDIGARTNARAEVRLLGMKIALMVAFATLRGQALWLKTILILMSSVVWLHSYIFNQPYINPRMNELQAAFGGIFALAFIVLCLGFVSSRPILIVMWALLAPVAGVAAALASRVFRQHIASSTLQDLSSSSRVLLWARTRLYMLKQLQKSTSGAVGDLLDESTDSNRDSSSNRAGNNFIGSIDSVLVSFAGNSAALDTMLTSHERAAMTAQLKDAAEYAYRWCAARFPTAGLVNLQTAAFYRSTNGSRYMELTALNAARKASNSIDIQFFAYQRNRQLREEGKGNGDSKGSQSSPVDRLMIDQHSAQAMKSEIKIREYNIRLWEELGAPIPDLAGLARLGRKLRDSIMSAEEHYIQLLKLQRQNAGVLRRYGSFMVNILGKMTKGQEMLAKADRVEDSQAGKFSRQIQNFTLMQETRKVVMSVESAAIIRASGDPSHLGEITGVSNQTAALFRRSPMDMVGMSLFDTMPHPLGSLLEAMLLHYVRAGSDGLLQHTRLTLIADSLNQLRTVRLNIREAPPEEDEIAANFLCVLQEVVTEDDFILCGFSDGALTGFAATSRSYRLMDIDTMAGQGQSIDLERKCPVIAGLARTYMEQVVEKAFDWKYFRASAGDGREVVSRHAFNPSGEHEGGQVSIQFQHLVVPKHIKQHANLDGPLMLIAWRKVAAVSQRPAQQDGPGQAAHAGSILTVKNPGEDGPSRELDVEGFPDSEHNSAHAIVHISGSKSRPAFEQASKAGSREMIPVLPPTGNSQDDDSIDLDTPRSILSDAGDKVSVPDLAPGKKDIAAALPTSGAELATLRGKADAHIGAKLEKKSLSFYVKKDKGASVAPAEFRSISERVRANHGTPAASVTGGSEMGGGNGSVASGGSSGSSITAPRTILLKLLHREGSKDRAIVHITVGLRVALGVALCLCVGLVVGMDIISTYTLDHVLSLSHIGLALRMLQGATVSAAQLNLFNLGIRVSQPSVILPSLQSEVLRTRARWRDVVTDSDTFDSLEQREQPGGLRFTVDLQDVDGSTASMSLNAAMGTVISNFDSLVKDGFAAFTLGNPSYSLVVNNVPVVMVDSLDETLSLRKTQASDFMTLVNNIILYAMTAAILALGICLGMFVMFQVRQLSQVRTKAIAVLLAVPVPALNSLRKMSKGDLNTFKQESGKKEQSDVDEEDSDEDGEAAGGGAAVGPMTDTASTGSGDSGSLGGTARFLATHVKGSGRNIATQTVGNRKVMDTAHFSAFYLGIFMLQVLLMVVWLSATTGSLVQSQTGLTQEMTRIYGTQQVATQIMKVCQGATLAVTLPPSEARDVAVETLMLALDDSLLELGKLLQGVEADEFSGQEVAALPTDGPAFELFSKDACPVIESNFGPIANCSTFDNGVMELGLQIILQRYLQRGRGIAYQLSGNSTFRVAEALAVAVATNGTTSTTLSSLDADITEEDLLLLLSRLRDLVSMEDPYIRGSMQALENIFISHVETLTSTAWEITVVINVLFFVFSFLLHFGLHIPQLSVIQAEADGAKSLLLAVPPEYLSKNKRYASGYKRYVASLASEAAAR